MKNISLFLGILVIPMGLMGHPAEKRREDNAHDGDNKYKNDLKKFQA